MQSVEQTTLSPIRPRQRYEQVADRLAADIRAGRLVPGERLPSERDLARRLEVGRASVREAIAALQVAGMLETRPGAGSFVAVGAAERSRETHDASPSDLLEARAMLEPAVARLAAAPRAAGRGARGTDGGDGGSGRAPATSRAGTTATGASTGGSPR